LKREARLTIDVKPRDPARLEQRGAEWLKQISTPSAGSDAATAASALACMRDPIAVPYLEQAASRTLAPRYIDALRALNHPDALEALVRLSQGADPDVRAMAERGLAGKQADFASPPCAAGDRR
jgi:HEAT repeat protein